MQVSAIAITSRASGSADIFAIGGPAWGMYHKTLKENETLTVDGWDDLGVTHFGAFGNASTNNISASFGAPAAVSCNENRIDVFGNTGSLIYHFAWTGGNWPQPASWQTLGAPFEAKNLVNLVGQPATVSCKANRFDLFALGADGAIYHKSWSEADGWSPPPPAGYEPQMGWDKLGGKFTSPPVVVSCAEGRLDVFALGERGDMQHLVWNTGDSWAPAPSWNSLGGSFTTPPAVVSAWRNQIDIFALGDAFDMQHVSYDANDGKAAFRSLGGQFNSWPAAVARGGAEIDVFALGGANDMRRLNLQLQDGDWQPGAWHSLYIPFEPDAGGIGVFSSAPAVASWGPRRFDVVALATDDHMHHLARDADVWVPPTDLAFNVWDDLGAPKGSTNYTGRTATFATALSPVAELVALPRGLLHGNSNYYFVCKDQGGNKNIKNLTVTLSLTEWIVLTRAGIKGKPTEPGFSIQLNTYSSKIPRPNPFFVWQQYSIGIDSVGIYYNADLWPINAGDTQVDLGDTPDPTKNSGRMFYFWNWAGDPFETNEWILSPHTWFVINLASDEFDNIFVANFYVVFEIPEPEGIANQYFTYLGQLNIADCLYPGINTSNSAYNREGYLAPIIGYQLNIVGSDNAASANFSFGAGNIFYYAEKQISAEASLPDGSAIPQDQWHHWLTGENSNVFYGELPTGKSSMIIQPYATVPNSTTPPLPKSLVLRHPSPPAATQAIREKPPLRGK